MSFKEDLTEPYEVFVGDLREVGGQDLEEVDIDFWELNAFELPLFQVLPCVHCDL